MSYATTKCLMQLKKCLMQLKKVAFLVACDTCSCIRQVAKDSFSTSECTRLQPPYLLTTIMAILPTKLVSATFLVRISFVIIVRKKDIRKFILPSSWNGSNFDYHGKICQHLPLPLNWKLRHLSLPLMRSPARVIPLRMLRRRITNVDKREVLQAHAAQVQTLQNELESLRAQLVNLKGKSS